MTALHTLKRGLPLALDGIGKAFGQRQVLKDIDLHIPAGQFVAVVGRSGCGKSTLLRLLAGLDQPSSGQLLAPTLEKPRPGSRMILSLITPAALSAATREASSLRTSTTTSVYRSAESISVECARQCMQTKSQPSSATVAGMSGSARPPLTSLIITAPAS